MPHDHRAVPRRKLLQLLSLGGGCLALRALFPSLVLAQGGGQPYYTDPARGFLGQFEQVCQGAKQMLAPRLGEGKAALGARKSLESFTAQLAHLPEVGGKRNPDSEFIVVAAWYAALGEGLLPLGLSAEDIGRLVCDMYAGEFQSGDPQKALAEGKARFTRESMAQGLAWAAWTRQRDYPGNWVAAFYVGDGQDFDFGYDYSECGVVKYLRSRGLPQLAPYVCLNDFIKSRAQGTGLQRTTTLALGYDRCDFRYKEGREVTQGWDSEAPKVKARMAERGFTG
jgi:hypothetical protein